MHLGMRVTLLLSALLPLAVATFNFYAPTRGIKRKDEGAETNSCINRCHEPSMVGSCICSDICKSAMFRSACCPDYLDECSGKQANKKDKKKLSYVEALEMHPFNTIEYPYKITDDKRPPCADMHFHAFPGDCSKFYRCVGNHQKKVYMIHYFNCPEGLMFNTKAQHCSREASEEKCRADPVPHPPKKKVPPTGDNTSTITPPSTPTPTITPPPTPTPTPTAILTETPETEEPITEGPCTECFDTMNNCGDYDVCPEGSNSPIRLTLCKKAFNECLICDSNIILTTTDYCEKGQFYNKLQNVCYDNPNATSMSCEGKDEECSNPGEVLGREAVKDEACKDVAICDNQLLFRGTVEVCKHYYFCNNKFKLKKKTCKKGKYFDFEHRECVDYPKEQECSNKLPTRLSLVRG